MIAIRFLSLNMILVVRTYVSENCFTEILTMVQLYESKDWDICNVLVLKKKKYNFRIAKSSL